GDTDRSRSDRRELRCLATGHALRQPAAGWTARHRGRHRRSLPAAGVAGGGRGPAPAEGTPGNDSRLRPLPADRSATGRGEAAGRVMAMKKEDCGARLLAEAYGDLSADVLRELFFRA